MPHLKELLFLTLLFSFSRADAINCLTASTSSTLEALITCFETYTVPECYYTASTYASSQPQTIPDELAAWKNTVTSLLNAAGSCPTVNGGISSAYSVSTFTETVAGGQTYCVLSEKNTFAAGEHLFAKGWGVVVVPRDASSVERNIHFSAPHPLYDSGTPAQAAAIFKRTRAKSLIVDGRHRKAYHTDTDCSLSPSPTDPYYKTDPAHDDDEPFHHALVAIRAWQNNHGGCPSASCAYIQMHGKSINTCSADNVFLSSGRASASCYSDTTLPVKRIQAQLNTYFPGRFHHTPAESACSLTATRNVFGRLVNGISEANICTTSFTSSCTTSTVYGQFVHMEQDETSRSSASYTDWNNVIRGAFP